MNHPAVTLARIALADATHPTAKRAVEALETFALDRSIVNERRLLRATRTALRYLDGLPYGGNRERLAMHCVVNAVQAVTSDGPKGRAGALDCVVGTLSNALCPARAAEIARIAAAA